MSEKIHVLARQVFGKSSLEACDLEEIKALVKRYPFFAPGQFLLLQKLKSLNDPGYSAQLQKSVLYYHNPLAFEYFINAERFVTEVDLKEPVPGNTEVIQTQEQSPAITSNDAEIIREEEILTNIDNNETPSVLEETKSIEEVTETEATLVENEALPAEEMELDAPTEEMPLAENEALPDLVDNISKPEPEVVNEAASPLAFEPFHTVDYFASQGIRLSQEEITKDKFGKQLKSFTEWLKTMKRLPAQEANMDASTEKKLEHLAEDSVHNPDVVTETMAEVWLKQGNTLKAIETYNKLSLLNPSKKAYFAGLIENLKRS